MVFVLPGLLLAPVVVEVALDYAHLLDGSLFGILLHARVNSSVYFQATGVQIGCLLVVATTQQAVASLGYRVAEVGSLSVVVVLYLIVQLDGLLAVFLVLATAQVTVDNHVVEHGVTAGQAVLGMALGVVVSSSLEHTYKHSGLVGGKLLGRFVEISLGRSLDTVGIGTEVDGVGIHGKYLLLAVNRL